MSIEKLFDEYEDCLMRIKIELDFNPVPNHKTTLDEIVEEVRKAKQDQHKYHKMIEYFNSLQKEVNHE